MGEETICVVCSLINTEGESRKSGFKVFTFPLIFQIHSTLQCKNCIGKKSKAHLRRQVEIENRRSQRGGAPKADDAAHADPTTTAPAPMPPADATHHAPQVPRRRSSTRDSRSDLPPVPPVPAQYAPPILAGPALSPPMEPASLISPTRTGGVIPIVPPELSGWEPTVVTPYQSPLEPAVVSEHPQSALSSRVKHRRRNTHIHDRPEWDASPPPPAPHNGSFGSETSFEDKQQHLDMRAATMLAQSGDFMRVSSAMESNLRRRAASVRTPADTQGAQGTQGVPCLQGSQGSLPRATSDLSERHRSMQRDTTPTELVLRVPNTSLTQTHMEVPKLQKTLDGDSGGVSAAHFDSPEYLAQRETAAAATGSTLRLGIPVEYWDQPQMSQQQRQHTAELRDAYLKGKSSSFRSDASSSPPAMIGTRSSFSGSFRARKEVSV